MNTERILVISDLHQPYGHPDTVPFLTYVKKHFNPTLVILTGDEVDWHSISFHDKDPNLPNALRELELAIDGLRPIYKLFPKAFILESNHGSLVLRKALSVGLPERVFKSYNEVLEAPKTWKWVPDMIVNTKLGPVYFCHGKASGAGKLSSQYGMSTVQGHYHERAQIYYTSTPERLIFDMHVGCLADDKSRALAYNKVNPKRPILTVGLIDHGVPKIFPMILNRQGRWIKR